MSKGIMTSVSPIECERIATGRQSILVRKSRPKLETPFKDYIYCTGGKLLFKSINGELYRSKYFNYNGQEDVFNCKVIGEFVCDEIIKDERGEYANLFIKQACLSIEEQKDYGGNRTLYGWHISDLKIYDKPKELGEFWTVKCTNKRVGCRDCKVKPNCIKDITRPPQSWCYVEEL